VRDVEVGVEAQLAEPAADLRDRRQQLVAQQPERRLQRLGGPEQLLLARLPLAADRRRASSANGDGVLHRAAVGALRVGEHEPRRARVIATCSSRRISPWRGLACRRERLLEQRVRDRLERALARAGHARAPSARARRRARTRALGRVHRHHLHAARALAGRASSSRRPGVGDRGDRARELARRGLRRAAHVGGASSANLARLRSRSTTSVEAANSSWRRRPSRSTSRCT
jgi:hypothetical protein